MSLVAAYGSSSDEDSDVEENDSPKIPGENGTPKDLPEKLSSIPITNGKKLNLPQPNKNSIVDDDETEDTSAFNLNLPQPKSKSSARIVEEDDEFLHKKIAPALVQKPTPPPPKRQPVKITIPSLADLKDGVYEKSEKIPTVAPHSAKPSGLLGMLPAPKFSAAPPKSIDKPKSTNTVVTKTTSLVPRMVAAKAKQDAQKASVKVNSVLASGYGDSDDSDGENSDGGDFFALNNEDELPAVNANEISAMVSKKAATMKKFANDLKRTATEIPNEFEHIPEDYNQQQASTSSSSKLVQRQYEEEVDLQALVGARAAKRARKDEIQFIDISQQDVTMNQDEWMRNQLQSETQYQPTGKLVGDPGAGTKKKHQITYLAYQAKANEQELQAMWAANRHTRRQTQSKYGF